MAVRAWLGCAVALAASSTLATGCSSERAAPTAKPLPQPDSFGPLVRGEPVSPRIANYSIDVEYDADEHRLTARQTLRWTNTGGSPVGALPFHLYLNAFKNEDSVFMRESRGSFRSAKSTDTGWGWIEVSSVRIAGGADVRDQGRYIGVGAEHGDQTVLEIPLATPVGPGETVEVAMEFEAQLPEVFARTGYKGEFTMVGQWFPKVGVLVGERGSETFHCEAFHANSEFFADFGTYDVTLNVPATHVVAATGVLTAAEEAGDGRHKLTYRAEDVHDFAWMIDPYVEFITGTATTEHGDVEVRVYAYPEQRAFAERHLHAAIETIEILSDRLVPYPWTRMSVIDPPPRAAGGAGGMEYPTIVTTAGDNWFTPEGVRMPEFVTVHEVGHNWFQGILASNEIDEAWLDEGTNEYIDGAVMEMVYGANANTVEWGQWRASHFRVRQNSTAVDPPAPIRTKSYEFPDNGAYGGQTYARTALALRTLENAVGPDRFAAALKRYAQRYAFKHPTGDDFFAALSHALGEDISWYVDPVFSGRAVPDLRVRSIKCRAQHEPRGVFGEGDQRKTVGEADAPDSETDSICDVLVVNYGDIQVDTEVEVELADGSSERFPWRRDRPFLRLELVRSSPVAAVTIDPDGRVPLNVATVKSSQRKDSQRDGRIGASMQFATQVFLQAVGL